MSETYPQYSLTNFPERVDEFKQFLDVVATDFEYLKTYQEELEKNNIIKAQEALNNIPSADQKVLTAKRFNELREAVLALEQFYSTDIESYIENKQIEWENLINRFEYKGTYNPSETYNINNFVAYNDNGITKMYINIRVGEITNIVPTNTTYWRELTIQGQRGVEGGQGTFEYEWDSGTAYGINAIVVYNNIWWVATQSSQNQAPYGGSEYWNEVLSVSTAIYPVQNQQPVSQATGELWFKVL